MGGVRKKMSWQSVQRVPGFEMNSVSGVTYPIIPILMPSISRTCDLLQMRF